MNRLLLALISVIIALSSCQTTEKKVDPISKEHAAFFGTWQENDSIDKTTWTFDRYEVKWKGFTHFYTVSNDSLIISGLVYKITSQTEKKIRLVKFNGKPCVLVKKK